MQKLVLNYFWGDEAACGYHTFAFEYESKNKFLFDCLEKVSEYKKVREKKEYDDTGITIFSSYSVFSISEIENFENNLYTLEEWFEKEKETPLL